jgi:hypothetical protein
MFGYVPPWLDMYLARREGVSTNPGGIGELGTLLAGVHSTVSTPRDALRNLVQTLNPRPTLQVHLKRCDRTPSHARARPCGQYVLWGAGTTPSTVRTFVLCEVTGKK